MTRVIFWEGAGADGERTNAGTGIRFHSGNAKKLKTIVAGQCDINTGTGIDLRMLRVTPPRMNSRKREWP
jgi:hypothetical protein